MLGKDVISTSINVALTMHWTPPTFPSTQCVDVWSVGVWSEGVWSGYVECGCVSEGVWSMGV